jgi:hypothetical protein
LTCTGIWVKDTLFRTIDVILAIRVRLARTAKCWVHSGDRSGRDHSRRWLRRGGLGRGDHGGLIRWTLSNCRNDDLLLLLGGDHSGDHCGRWSRSRCWDHCGRCIIVIVIIVISGCGDHSGDHCGRWSRLYCGNSGRLRRRSHCGDRSGRWSRFHSGDSSRLRRGGLGRGNHGGLIRWTLSNCRNDDLLLLLGGDHSGDHCGRWSRLRCGVSSRDGSGDHGGMGRGDHCG